MNSFVSEKPVLHVVTFELIVIYKARAGIIGPPKLPNFSLKGTSTGHRHIRYSISCGILQQLEVDGLPEESDYGIH
jgi:hypothetical protein